MNAIHSPRLPRQLAPCLAALILTMSLMPTLVAQDPPDSVDRDYSAELPRIAPQDVADALKTFHVRQGYRIELVAAEPQVVDPIAIDFDESLGLYAIEMRGYSEDDQLNLGRIRLLRDQDRDGKYEASTIFAEGLSWPTALVCSQGGVFVAAAPDIWFFRDRDGDGVADERRVVLTGLGRSNVQGLVNSLQVGLDGRIHGATSSSGGSLRRPDIADAPTVELRGRDFAFDPRTLVVTATGGGGQHGMSFDPWGHKFVCSNSNHIQYVWYDDSVTLLNPWAVPPPIRTSIASDGPQADVFRKSPVEPWRIVRTRLRRQGIVPGPVERGGKAAGYFTGATGVTLYQGTAFPTENLNADESWAIIGDVGSNLVHRKRVTPQGLGFVASRVDPNSELLASSDIWFRPVQFANGPDGSLYICDMYREVIEHPKSLHPVIKQHLDLTSGRDRGRIYRLLDASRSWEPPQPLAGQGVTRWLELLEHPNGWQRRTAARLLYERLDSVPANRLREQFSRTHSPAAKVQLMYLLEATRQLDAATLLQALQADQHAVRETAVRLMSGPIQDSESFRVEALKLIDPADVRMGFHLAISLAGATGPAKLEALAAIASAHPEDPYIRFAVQAAVRDDAGELLVSLARQPAPRRPLGLVQAIATQIAKQRRVADLALLTALAPSWSKHEPKLFDALVAGLGQADDSTVQQQVRAAMDQADGSDWERILSQSAKVAQDRNAIPSQRLAALQRLRMGDADQFAGLLTQLLSVEEPAEIQRTALQVLASYDEPEVVQVLLEQWSQLTPEIRGRLIDTLMTRPVWLKGGLERVLAGALPASAWGTARLQTLQDHPDEQIQKLVRQVMARMGSANRQDVLRRYARSLTISGHRERGRAVFQKQCSKCHQWQGQGHPVGPNLAAMRNRGAEAILANVLDPNREVNPEFVSYVVQTRDGRILTGMIVAETGASLTLKRDEGITDTLLRVDIEAIKSSGKSLMPEGLEKEIDPQQMADLLAFLTRPATPPSEETQPNPFNPNHSDQAGNPREADPSWIAGVARHPITPQQPMWLAGYGSRDRPFEGVLQELWAKALVLEAGEGQRALLLTLDLVGIDRTLSSRICDELSREFGFRREQIAICTSHTHSGPVVGQNLAPLHYELVSAPQQALIDSYADQLQRGVVSLVRQALNNRQPCELAWGSGTCSFAVNRRNNSEAEVARLRQQGQLAGPTDHDVPVLVVRSKDKQALQAVVFGYACHATVLSGYQVCGDYPGYAQQQLEIKYPEAVAMFWAGCGADQNPLPRRQVELAQQYGRALADAVSQVMAHQLRPLRPALACQYREVELRLAELPSKEHFEKALESRNRFEAARAKRLLRDWNQGTPPAATYPYPIGLWRLGNEVQFFTLGGEVVVDYALRIKAEQNARQTWVAGYAHDVMAYIPSLRVLNEGGYEGGGAMVYYGLPAAWSVEVQRQILEAVRELVADMTPGPAR